MYCSSPDPCAGRTQIAGRTGGATPSRVELYLSGVFSVQIYDIQTGQKIQTLSDPALANNYKRNCATFNPSDDLVLNDGVMWDVRSARAIHKFDKFNMNISGVFHPNGLEVIVNTEIVSYFNTSTILLQYFCQANPCI